MCTPPRPCYHRVFEFLSFWSFSLECLSWQETDWGRACAWKPTSATCVNTLTPYGMFALPLPPAELARDPYEALFGDLHSDLFACLLYYRGFAQSAQVMSGRRSATTSLPLSICTLLCITSNTLLLKSFALPTLYGCVSMTTRPATVQSPGQYAVVGRSARDELSEALRAVVGARMCGSSMLSSYSMRNEGLEWIPPSVSCTHRHAAAVAWVQVCLQEYHACCHSPGRYH